MEPIVVTRINGSTYVLNSVCEVASAKQVRSLMEDDYVEMELESFQNPGVAIGDRITVYGREYRMNTLPQVTKQGSRSFSVTARWEGVQYDMGRVAFLMNVSTTEHDLQDVQGSSMVGDVKAFLDVLVENMNRVFPDQWAVGAYPSGTSQDTLLTFEEDANCLGVLQEICDSFENEFDITTSGGVHYVNIRKRNVTYPYAFSYGHGNGLYELERENTDSSNVVNKLYVYGGSKNLPDGYHSDRLVLQNKRKSTSFITDSVLAARYGVYEGVRVYDDIYPTRTGTVDGISTADRDKMTDSTMFDLNETWADTPADYAWYLELRDIAASTEAYNNYVANVVGNTKYLVSGTAAKVHFNSGNLAGYDFEVQSYDSQSHEFTLNRITDEGDREIPSDTEQAFQIAVGDTYTLTDIMLPKSYITSAQVRLNTAAQADFDIDSAPKVRYRLQIDEQFVRWKSPADTVAIDCGDYVQIEDASFVSSPTSIRVRSVERDVLMRYRYELELEDSQSFLRGRRQSTGGHIGERQEPDVPSGLVYTPSVSAQGVISWRNNGGLENPVSVDIRGPQGATGAQGPQGEKGDKGDTGAAGASATMSDHTCRQGSATDYQITTSTGRNFYWFELSQALTFEIKVQGSNDQSVLFYNPTANAVAVRIVNVYSGGSVIGCSSVSVPAGGYYWLTFKLYNTNLIVIDKSL